MEVMTGLLVVLGICTMLAFGLYGVVSLREGERRAMGFSF